MYRHFLTYLIKELRGVVTVSDSWCLGRQRGSSELPCAPAVSVRHPTAHPSLRHWPLECRLLLSVACVWLLIEVYIWWQTSGCVWQWTEVCVRGSQRHFELWWCGVGFVMGWESHSRPPQVSDQALPPNSLPGTPASFETSAWGGKSHRLHISITKNPFTDNYSDVINILRTAHILRFKYKGMLVTLAKTREGWDVLCVKTRLHSVDTTAHERNLCK